MLNNILLYKYNFIYRNYYFHQDFGILLLLAFLEEVLSKSCAFLKLNTTFVQSVVLLMFYNDVDILGNYIDLIEFAISGLTLANV